MKERRKFVRAGIQSNIKWARDIDAEREAKHEDLTKNIGGGGICISTNEQLEKEERLRNRENFDFPLLWFGIYRQPLIYNHSKRGFRPGPLKEDNYCLKNIRPNISADTYLQAIERIKKFIARGYTYQVNFTFKLKFSFFGSALALYSNLRNKGNNWGC